MQQKTAFIQGTFQFEGKGFGHPVPLDGGATFKVPADMRAQLVYMRAGNSSGELISVVLARDGKLMRHFPIGARAGYHVPLAVLEDIFPDSLLEVLVAAPVGVAGVAVVDLGLVIIE